MKVAELREKLSTLKQKELIFIAVEFYKLISKAKKEDNDLDSLINNPNPSNDKAKTNKKLLLSLEAIENEVNQFIANAKSQYYLFPNRIVPKKERSNWRFKIKQWYNELINTKRKDADTNKQSEILSNLYELICESCGFDYFSAYDSFQSIGIDQVDFFKSTLTLIQEAKGKGDSIEKGIRLIMDNYLNHETLYSDLMIKLIETLDLPDLKNKGIEIVEKLILENGYKPGVKEKTRSVSLYGDGEFKKKQKNNILAELGYRLYSSLFEMQEAIDFYERHFDNMDDEVKLYTLVLLLFKEQKKELIKSEIEKSIRNGIKPRERILNLLKEIKDKGRLPEYF